MKDLAHAAAVGHQVRLGRSQKSPAPKLKLVDYLTGDLPNPRRSVGHAVGLDDFHMLGNDSLGDCTCAALEHALHVISWQDQKGTKTVESDQAAIDLYWKTGTQDNGRMLVDPLAYARRNGYNGRSDAVIAYLEVDPRNIEHVCTGIDLFGGCDIGINMPVSAQSQSRCWDVSATNSEPGSWGGHAVWVPGYNKLKLDNSALAGWFPLITWGKRMYMTQRFWDKYVDEAIVMISGEWLDAAGKSPRGFDLAKLQHDLNQL